MLPTHGGYSDLFSDLLKWLLTTLQSLHFPRRPFQLQTLSHTPSPTSWLDGMRGYAAFFVILYHLRQAYTPSVHTVYGTTENDRNPLQLPVIRLIFAGQAMVALFFVVSGYSLSWGPAKELRNGNVGKCLERIRSSLFRRAPRLYLPTLASAFVAMFFRSLGLYEWAHQMDIRLVRAPEPERFGNFFLQFGDYFSKSLDFLNVWRGEAHAYYLPSWTIPTEFKCSILLYVGLIAVAKLRLVPRAVGFAIMIIYCFWTGNWFLWLFLIGSAFAQINSYVQRNWSEGFPPKDTRERFAFKAFILCLGLWLLSFPDASWLEAPGYDLFSHISPSGDPFWFWWGVGTILIGWSASSNASIQYIFSCRLARYLGRISFAMYLVHDVVIYVLGLWMLPTVWNVTGMNTTLRFEIGFFIVATVVVVVTFVGADLFTTAFDDTSVHFATWLEKRLVVREDSEGYQRLPMSTREVVPEMHVQ